MGASVGGFVASGNIFSAFRRPPFIRSLLRIDSQATVLAMAREELAEGFVVLVTAAESGGAFELFEISGRIGPPMHVHDEHVECFYVLQGEVTFRVVNSVIRARPGECAVVPRGTPHRFTGTTDARMILLVSPAGLEEYFRQLLGGTGREELATRFDSHPV